MTVVCGRMSAVPRSVRNHRGFVVFAVSYRRLRLVLHGAGHVLISLWGRGIVVDLRCEQEPPPSSCSGPLAGRGHTETSAFT